MTEGMTLSDFAALEKMGNRHRGVANTALGLGIAGLAVALVGAWGVNAISAARSRAAENISAANANRTSDLYALIAAERGSREAWQTRNQPSIGQYVDVQTNPQVQSTIEDIVSAMATASAAATATANNNGINSAVGHDSFLKVQRYSAPQPCGCDSCNG
jgi:Zn-dependent alcohol dehydrogenase